MPISLNEIVTARAVGLWFAGGRRTEAITESQAAENIHNITFINTQIHAGPLQQAERNKKGARLVVAQLVFHKFVQETTQQLLQKTVC